MTLPLATYRYGAVLLCGLVIGGAVMRSCHHAPIVSGDDTRVVLPKTEIKPADVAPILTSPEAVKAVAKQRKAGVTVTAAAQTSGVIRIPAPTFTNGEQAAVSEQKVEAVAVAGTDKAGLPNLTLDVYAVGQDGARTPIADSVTRVVVSEPLKPRWRVSFAIQAGAGYVTTTAGKGWQPMAVVGLQWLKRGSSTAAEHCSLSLLSPAVLLDATSAEPGLLPVSVNLGRIKHQPLKDIWIGPYVGLNAGKVGHLGAALTATF
jgi:hypothetical protein